MLILAAAAAAFCGLVLCDGHGRSRGVSVGTDGGSGASQESGPSHNVCVDLSVTKNLATCERNHKCINLFKSLDIHVLGIVDSAKC